MPKQTDEFLSNFPHSIRLIVDELSGLIFQTFPSIKEKLIASKDSFYYVDYNLGHVFTLIIKNDYVELGFENGVDMKDEYDLFTREKKRVRYIKFNPGKDIDRRKIEKYLQT